MDQIVAVPFFWYWQAYEQKSEIRFNWFKKLINTYNTDMGTRVAHCIGNQTCLLLHAYGGNEAKHQQNAKKTIALSLLFAINFLYGVMTCSVLFLCAVHCSAIG